MSQFDDKSRKTLQNKIIDGGPADNQHKILLPAASKSELDSIVRDESAIYYASDEEKVYVDNGSSLIELGSGSGGMATDFSNAVPSAADLDLNGHTIFNLGDPSDDQDAATKIYVDNASSQSANINLSNLDSPTAVNQSLIPDDDNSIDVGSSNKRIREMFVASDIQMANAAPVMGRNSADSTNFAMIQVDTDDIVKLGDPGSDTAVRGNSVAVDSVQIRLNGAVTIPNNVNLSGRNAADTSDVPLIFINSTDGIYIGDPSVAVTLYADSVAMQVNSSGSGLAYIVGSGVSATLAFLDDASSAYIGLKAPASLSSITTVFTLPASDGIAGDVLTTNGSGQMSFTTQTVTAVVLSDASAGGASSEILTVTGLLATDTIISVSQQTPGGNNTAVTGWSGQADNALTVQWTANPGANAVVAVAVLR